MQPWKTLERKLILHHSKWLSVEDHTLQLPDGTQIEQWPWIISPDYVNVVVQEIGGAFICFRQTKYAVEGISLAPVGGYLEPGEEPLACAKRELREELGCEAKEWIPLGSFPCDGNHGNGTAHLFYARGAEKTGEIFADDLEEQEIVRLTRSELRSALVNKEFKVLSWTTAVALALMCE
ncbi:MAG: NUDIX hydrolase [Bacteroidetes bacterium]|nr:NUDIX hydrolase [Bacteroidota bacterium]